MSVHSCQEGLNTKKPRVLAAREGDAPKYKTEEPVVRVTCTPVICILKLSAEFKVFPHLSQAYFPSLPCTLFICNFILAAEFKIYSHLSQANSPSLPWTKWWCKSISSKESNFCLHSPQGNLSTLWNLFMCPFYFVLFKTSSHTPHSSSESVSLALLWSEGIGRYHWRKGFCRIGFYIGFWGFTFFCGFSSARWLSFQFENILLWSNMRD